MPQLSRTALLTVLGAVFGLQALRAFFPLLVYVLRDRGGVDAAGLGGIGAALFATAILWPRVLANRDPARALAGTVLAVALGRGALQLWVGDPAVSFAIAAVTVIAFLAFLAAASRLPLDVGTHFLAGALLDTSIHATAGTRDLHWGGTFPDLAAAALLVPALFFSLRMLRPPDVSAETRSLHTEGDTPAAGDAPAAGVPAEERKPEAGGSEFPVHPVAAFLTPAVDASSAVSRGWGLLAWGPFLFLHLEWLGNVARLSARTGLSTPHAGALLTAGLAAGILLARHLPRQGFWAGLPAVLLVSTFFARGLIWSGVTGPLAFPALLVTQLAGATLLARILRSEVRSNTARDCLACGLGSLAFFVLLFGHYAGYAMPLPTSFPGLLIAAGTLLLGISLVGRVPEARTLRRLPPVVAVGLVFLSLAPLLRPSLVQGFGTDSAPHPGEAGFRAPITAVSFNLHVGFDELGDFTLDSMLDALASVRPDVVALQEVSRGWVINGSADLFELTRERLAMPGVFGAATGFDWGNAVFARWPARRSRVEPLPPPGLLLQRSVTLVDLEGPEGVALRVLATHYHHPIEDPGPREEHSRFLAELAGCDDRTTPSLLLGDFNAVGTEASMRILAECGWRDCFEPGDVTSRTYPSKAPERRIDTIFTRGALIVEDARVAPPWGSDHRAVIARVHPAGRLSSE